MTANNQIGSRIYKLVRKPRLIGIRGTYTLFPPMRNDDNQISLLAGRLNGCDRSCGVIRFRYACPIPVCLPASHRNNPTEPKQGNFHAFALKIGRFISLGTIHTRASMCDTVIIKIR
ncbi:hypothetical protein D3C74_390470 [compost metagenome]